ncbi:polysaccharide deacetylase family protein [Chloroflexota bacterium]
MMNINVLVDREDGLEWLKYTLDSFTRLSKANIKFSLVTKKQQFQGIVIAYGTVLKPQNHKVLSIPRATEYLPGNYHYIVTESLEDGRVEGSSIPIFQKTFAPVSSIPGKVLLKNHGSSTSCASLADNEIKISFDLFYNCFIRLSCLQEWNYEEESGPIQSYATKLKGMVKMDYQMPVANYLFAILEDMLLMLADESIKGQLFAKRSAFKICLTHDVDFVRKTALLRTKRSAFHMVRGLQNIRKAQFSDALGEVSRSFNFLVMPQDYWQFEYIQGLEEKHNFKSTFYFYTRVKSKQIPERLRRLLFDPGYDIEKNKKLRTKIKELTEQGWEVGLHGSFDSYNRPELFKEEKKRLEAVSGVAVISTRQHWLHLSMRDTWRIQAEAGILADTTQGFNDCFGFRAGIASPFYPYDFINQKSQPVLEIPMLLMDGTLFDYCMMDKDEALENSIKVLEEVKKFDGCVAINWHENTPAADYGWYGVYEKILDWISENNGEGIPVSKTLAI